MQIQSLFHIFELGINGESKTVVFNVYQLVN